MAKTQKKPKSREDYEQEIGELTATLQRVQADFENYKKRSVAGAAQIMDSAKISVLSDLLPALDNFDRAATHLPKELENNNWAQGMAYVGQQLEKILEEIGVQKFAPLNEVFDHNKHDAVEYIKSTKPEGTILEVITPGYMVGDRIVRPAIVKVSSGQNKHNQVDNQSKAHKEGEANE